MILSPRQSNIDLPTSQRMVNRPNRIWLVTPRKTGLQFTRVGCFDITRPMASTPTIPNRDRRRSRSSTVSKNKNTAKAATTSPATSGFANRLFNRRLAAVVSGVRHPFEIAGPKNFAILESIIPTYINIMSSTSIPYPLHQPNSQFSRQSSAGEISTRGKQGVLYY